MTARAAAATAALAAAIAWQVFAPAALAGYAPGPLDHFLVGQMGLSATDLATLRQGQVVATLPAADDPREIAAFGAVLVNAPNRVFADALFEVEALLRGDAVSEVGRFSATPSIGDLDGLTLQDADLEALRACRIGNCGLKLSAAMVADLQRDVPWATPAWRDQATLHFKRMLVDYVAAYQRDGHAALAEYVDKPLAVKLADETRALISSAPYLQDHTPELVAQLGRPASVAAAATLPGARQVVFWAKEQFGFKPTITITALTIYQPGGTDAPVVAVTTQIYATHYFEGSVTLWVAAAFEGAATPGFALIYLNRSRIDALRGGLAGLKRFTAGRRIRHRVEGTLQQHRTFIERQATRAIH